MEIKAIKEQLAIETVLQHYGLKSDRQHRLLCPFHNDKTPSLQIYPKTGTYCCFSSNCTAGTGDVIQFIQLKENCSKHEAITKAASLVNGNTITVMPANNKIQPAENNLDKIAVLSKVFAYFKIGLPCSKKAMEYINSRSINHQPHEIGYNSGGLHRESKNHHLVERMVKYGLLKPNAAKGYSVWAKDCVVFPLKNKDNKIVSLYGRSIINDNDSRHFYLQNRQGLYPGYPKAETTKLIITESIIDAVSLLQQSAITNTYEILSLYGTNGLTQEHLQAIIALPHLQEIIFMLNADDAGKSGVQKQYSTLSNLLPGIAITNVELPEGEDVNSLLQTHEDTQILTDLVEQRKLITAIKPDNNFLFSNEKENPAPILSNRNKLNTANTELLLYDDSELYIEILGGIKITGLDRMKVTLKILHKETTQLPLWHSLDLYQHDKREQLINSIADAFDMGTTVINTVIAELIRSLEDYRLQKIESLQKKPEQQPEMTAAQRQAAITELQKPNLLQRTSEMIALSGIVGETTNSLIAYLVYSTRKQHIPLHVMFLGSSGSGKTYLQEKISELIPDEDKIEITQITENALYYFKQHELQNKLILIEDLDGALSVFYPLRELQTKRRISKTVALKDSRGNLKTITITVEGPVCVSGCTTKEKIYEDNANRCLLLYIDQGREQDKRITEYQTRSAAGEINKQRERQYKELFKNMQRILQPVRIINPYAKYIELPEQVFKPRRTMTLLLGFIEAITFYHQYQREVKEMNITSRILRQPSVISNRLLLY